MTKIRSLITYAVLLVPAVALAAPRTWSELVDSLVSLMNYGVATLVALAIALYFYGISSNILKLGENEPEKKKAYFFWGIIILFVMVSVWGILRIVRYTLFG
ncbi:hypothetical protein A3F27_02955 [Candidatus Kaiserbacteria bacterium RIFCSPHIGHO2_12_FULL_53_13]|uniref:Uncharacterized protein n=1 Tax=Candidatus Kaiserbacteria bacterium RIFCSPHIGHO2_12_FULL_53_13 TaxID=1798502 RepID=A0A1F6EAC8_9BACT|nr:MAG: hypothetical protein A3F27_02955 [Candidatus Kaiserbacteria bacterium RIFCSPHIGHO2_12_FULL_53_13]OGG74524.1 MAG: hypothetical protein A3A37_02980 [Candidatus Kaiserbacteria bacterium RIFCSPLOWO2_01_FULL_52_36]